VCIWVAQIPHLACHWTWQFIFEVLERAPKFGLAASPHSASTFLVDCFFLKLAKSHWSKPVAAAVSCALLISACAQKADNISAAYVSPMAYASYSCPQLREEASRVSARAIQVSGAQDSKATGDAVATGVGVILFWPALFLIKGDSTTAAEVSRLKGEMEAIEQTSIQKRCGIQFQRTAAT